MKIHALNNDIQNYFTISGLLDKYICNPIWQRRALRPRDREEAFAVTQLLSGRRRITCTMVTTALVLTCKCAQHKAAMCTSASLSGFSIGTANFLYYEALQNNA